MIKNNKSTSIHNGITKFTLTKIYLKCYSHISLMTDLLQFYLTLTQLCLF